LRPELPACPLVGGLSLLRIETVASTTVWLNKETDSSNDSPTITEHLSDNFTVTSLAKWNWLSAATRLVRTIIYIATSLACLAGVLVYKATARLATNRGRDSTGGGIARSRPE